MDMKKCKKFGFVGFRGLVGTTLMERLIQENNNKDIESASFFSSSAANKPVSKKLQANFNTKKILLLASDFNALKDMDVIVTCQGSEYSRVTLPKLRELGWKGYWVDAASRLRQEEDSVIILPPINQDLIEESLKQNKLNYIGANCTVSLMLLALGGLIRKDMISWISAITYQAASGAGSSHLKELLRQFSFISNATDGLIDDDLITVLDLEKRISKAFHDPAFPKEDFSVPLAGSLIPFIDSMMDNGQSREEWKAEVEANKILARGANKISIDGICVRVGTLRCHSQALTIKLHKNYSMDEISEAISGFSQFVKLIPNDEISSKWLLSPVQVSGMLDIYIGRLRKYTFDDTMLSAFTVGDQLLWGAAEPLRCLIARLSKGSW